MSNKVSRRSVQVFENGIKVTPIPSVPTSSGTVRNRTFCQYPEVGIEIPQAGISQQPR